MNSVNWVSLCALAAVLVVTGCSGKKDEEADRQSESAALPQGTLRDATLSDSGATDNLKVVDLLDAGTIGSAGLTFVGSTLEIADENATEHAMAFWTLPGLQPDTEYEFMIDVSAGSASGASLVQVDVQTGADKQSYECMFDAVSGEFLPRNAANASTMSLNASGGKATVRCAARTLAAVDSLYIYVGPAVGSAVGSYDPAATGRFTVNSITYRAKPAA